MGCNSSLYKFENFICIQKNPPKNSGKSGFQKFEFEIHPYSEDYIRQRLDSQYNPDTDGTEESFLISEEDNMKVFEYNDELSTKRDKISSCLENALMGKITGDGQARREKSVIVFLEPAKAREEYKRILFEIIVGALISLDMTCWSKERGEFGVYFDWPLYFGGRRPDFMLNEIRSIHQRNTTMGKSKKP